MTNRTPHHLQLTDGQLADIHKHAVSTYPEECCGILIGLVERESATTLVDRLVTTSNTREDEARHNRYLIEPQTILDAQREADREGKTIVGYYHSHPDHPSEPSDFDREYAWPDQSYLIVSVNSGRVHDERSWRLRDDRSAFDQEELIIDKLSATEREAS